MGSKTVKEFWINLDVKKLICVLCTAIVSLVVYVRQTDMNLMERNHYETLQAIEKLEAAVDENKKRSIVKIDKLDDRVLNNSIKIASLENKGRKEGN